jgi:hypothetical protein
LTKFWSSKTGDDDLCKANQATLIQFAVVISYSDYLGDRKSAKASGLTRQDIVRWIAHHDKHQIQQLLKESIEAQDYTKVLQIGKHWMSHALSPHSGLTLVLPDSFIPESRKEPAKEVIYVDSGSSDGDFSDW